MIFYYFLAIAYPIIYPPDCKSQILWQDFPYYGYAFLVFLLEIHLLFNISSIIASDRIFNIYSISTITSLYVSQVSKYDLYTDVQFATKTWYCTELNSYDISISSIIILSINLLYTFYNLWNSII